MCVCVGGDGLCKCEKNPLKYIGKHSNHRGTYSLKIPFQTVCKQWHHQQSWRLGQ